VNGLGTQHRDYLARGGHGFLLGDGALKYGPERIVEAYYTRFFSLRAHLDVPDPAPARP